MISCTRLGKNVFYLLITACSFISTTQGAEQQPQKEYRADSLTIFANREKQVAMDNSIALKTAIPNRSLPASIAVVTAALVQNQAGQNLTDAMKNVSGVNLQAGYGVHEYFILRGFNSLDNGLVLTDQNPEPETTVYDVYNLERVELLKGPAAVLYGGYQLAGAVNLARKKPLFQRFAVFSSSYGSFNSLRETIDLGCTNNAQTLAVRVNGLWQQSDQYRKDKKMRLAAVNPALLWRPNEKHQADISLEYVDNHYQPDTGLPLVFNFATRQLDQLPQVSRDNNYQSPWDVSDQKISRIKAGYTRKWHNDRQMQLRFFYTDLDWDSRGTLINGAYPSYFGGYLVSRTLPLLQDRQKWYGLQWQYNTVLTTGPLQHRIVAGMDAQRLTDDFDYKIIPQLSTPDLYHPIAEAKTAIPTAYPYLHGNTTSDILAPYAADLLRISRIASFLLGGRFDHIHYQDPGRKREQTFKPLSPLAGLTITPATNHTVYAQWGQAFAPPSSLVSANLEAEESRQFEIGYKSEWPAQHLQCTVAGYELKKFNMPIPDVTGITKQIGDQRSRGVELEVVYQPMPKWTSFINYAWCDAELVRFAESVAVGQDQYGQPVYSIFNRSGHQPAFAPAHLAGIWSMREFDFGLGIGAGVRYQSEQYIDEDNVVLLDPVWIVDAMIYYRQTHWKWQVNVKNLTDAQYWLRGNGGNSLLPAAPRAIFAGLEIML
jgi:TonB-dependent siderophore receptor